MGGGGGCDLKFFSNTRIMMVYNQPQILNVTIYSYGDQLPLEVLFRLNRLGLWPNDPIRGRRHIRGQSTKVEVEIEL